jgi:NADH-quinone oxidoreductase subunit F
VCNGAEGEPGTFKDRTLLRRNPYQLLEGMAIASFAINAKRAFLCIKKSFEKETAAVGRALAEMGARGFFGPALVELVLGPEDYLFGEEKGLLEVIEGGDPMPREADRPPYVEGLFVTDPAQRNPAVVNNAETLSNVPHIVLRGADWYAGIGPPKSTGPRLFSVSGHVERPGNYELPMSITLRELIFEHAGGIRDGRRLKAVTPGGSSAPVLTEQHLDVTMDFESLAAAGSMGGSGGVIVMDDTVCMVRVGEIVSRFYHHESCGQCTQCREGTAWLHKVLRRIEHGQGRKEDLDVLLDMCDNMKGKTICVLSDAAAMPIESYLKYFREEFEAHIRERACPFAGKGTF